ncbi:hypothetical protein J3E69DRAFT_32301 [Trichoderma sp. SZMC 28015]
MLACLLVCLSVCFVCTKTKVVLVISHIHQAGRSFISRRQYNSHFSVMIPYSYPKIVRNKKKTEKPGQLPAAISTCTKKEIGNESQITG